MYNTELHNIAEQALALSWQAELPNIAKRALAPDWQAAQVYRWATRHLTRRAAADRAGISLYAHDKIYRTRISPDGDMHKTKVYSRKEWRDM